MKLLCLCFFIFAAVPALGAGVCKVKTTKKRIHKISFPKGREITVVSFDDTRQGPITAGGWIEEALGDIYRKKPRWDTVPDEFYKAIRVQKAIDGDQPYYPLKVYTDKLTRSRDHNKDLLEIYREILKRVESEKGFIAADLETNVDSLDRQFHQLDFLIDERFSKIGIDESTQIVNKKKDSIRTAQEEPLGGRERHLNFQQEKIDEIINFKKGLDKKSQQSLKDDSYLILTSPVGYSVQAKKADAKRVHFLGSSFIVEDPNDRRSEAEKEKAVREKREKLIDSIVELPGNGTFFQMENSLDAVKALIKKCKDMAKNQKRLSGGAK